MPNVDSNILLNGAVDEIKGCETEVEDAYNDFRQLLSESISEINFFKYKLELHDTRQLNINEPVSQTDNTPTKVICEMLPNGLETSTVSPKDEIRQREVQNLQEELKNAVLKSSLSIRRSLLMFNSLFSQHELIFLPYCEMKAYYNQLQHRVADKLNNSLTNTKSSYAEALKDLEMISKEISETSQRTLSLAQKGSDINSCVSIVDDPDEFTDA